MRLNGSLGVGFSQVFLGQVQDLVTSCGDRSHVALIKTQFVSGTLCTHDTI